MPDATACRLRPRRACCFLATPHAPPCRVLCGLDPGLVLVLAKLCVHMETTTVSHVVEVLAGAFQGNGLTGSDGPPRFVGGEVARRLGATASEFLCRTGRRCRAVSCSGAGCCCHVAHTPGREADLGVGVQRRGSHVATATQSCLGCCCCIENTAVLFGWLPYMCVSDLLLSTYVELHGSELSLLVQQSMAAADWLSLPAPTAPQPVCGLLLQRLSRAEAEVGRLLDSTGRQQGEPGEG